MRCAIGKRKYYGCYGNGFIFGSTKLFELSATPTSVPFHSRAMSFSFLSVFFFFFFADVLANRIGPVSLIRSNTHVVHGKREDKLPKHS